MYRIYKMIEPRQRRIVLCGFKKYALQVLHTCETVSTWWWQTVSPPEEVWVDLDMMCDPVKDVPSQSRWRVLYFPCKTYDSVEDAGRAALQHDERCWEVGYPIEISRI